MVKRQIATLRSRLPRIPRIKLVRPAGTSPGTLSVPPGSPPPRITIYGYGPDDFVQTTLERPEQVLEHRGRWPVIWVNVDGLGDHAVIAKLGELFSIHPLALEDVGKVHQRAKVEPYDDQLFIVARMVHLEPRLHSEQLTLFLGSDYVLTFQERVGDSFDLVRQRITSGRKRLRSGGPDYLAYALLDALIDGYFPVLERFSERLEALEEQVLENPIASAATDAHTLKRDLLSVRRAVWPHREAIGSLAREESALIKEETRLFLRDAYDHTVQLIDMVETYRELASGLMDLYLSSLGHRTNEIMKVLTIFAAIFIPLSFIAGLYGMNFSADSPWNMPELDWRYGYPAALGLMATVAATMLYFFRRRGWLGGGKRRSET